jgi:hypothetical protein
MTAVQRALLARADKVAVGGAPVALRPFMPPDFTREGKRMPKRVNFNKLVKEALQRDDPQSQEIARRLAAAAVGADVSEVPYDLATPADFAIWVSSMLASAGSIEHLRELSDRAAPKPRRVELTGEGGGPIRHAVTAIGGGSGDAPRVTAAQDYYALLDGAIDVEFEEAPTPEAPQEVKGEIPEDFLE